MPSASGPRCATSASAASGVSSQTPARLRRAFSVSTSFEPPASSSANAGVFGPFSPALRNLSRPEVMRWMTSTSSPSSVGKKRRLPRRSAPLEATSLEGGERRVERLQRGDVRRPGLRDRNGGNRVIELAPPRLHLRKLRHRRQPVAGSTVCPRPGRLRALLRQEWVLRPARASSGSSVPARAAPRGTSARPPIAPTQSAARRPTVWPIAPPSERPERDRSPDDPAHGRVHPSLQPLGRDRLAEADLRDVVRDAAEAERRARPAISTGSGNERGASGNDDARAMEKSTA